MKKILLTLSLAVLVMMISSLSFAEPIFYLDFDMKQDMQMESGDQYDVRWDERATSVSAIYAETLGGTATTVDIMVPNGNGTDLPDTEGPQGGKAMLIESGGFEEGFNIEMSGPYHLGDHTVEVCFWSASNNLAGNTVGLSDIWCSDWPTPIYLQNTLRILGNGAPIGRDEDSQHLEMVCWQPGPTAGEEIRIVSTDVLTPQEWHTAQFVFDYNEADPANCTFYFYLDGALQGSAAYNAAVSYEGQGSTGRFMPVWGTPAIGSGSCREDIGGWRFGLGISNNRLVNGTDNRGLKGAIDAFCISEGALDAEDFVLPKGYEFPAPLEVEQDWNLYE